MVLTVGLTTQAEAARRGRTRSFHGRTGGVGRRVAPVRIIRAPVVRPARPRLRHLLAGIRGIIGGRRYVHAPRGHWETRTVAVLVEPAHWELRTIPARYELYRGAFGELVRVCVEPARTVRVWVPDRYEYRTQRVWVVR